MAVQIAAGNFPQLLPTPDAYCWKQGERGTGTGGGQQLGSALFTDPNGPDGPMRLSPLFVRWLMGFPPGWLDVECPRSARSATPSSRRSLSSCSGQSPTSMDEEDE